MGTVTFRQKNALDLLVEQHDRIDALLEAVANEPLIERKQFLLEELAAVLTAHATMEEKLFYPVVRAVQTQELLDSSNHVAIRLALAQLRATDVDDAHFDVELAVLAEEIHQHAREDEEEIVFPKLRRLMSEEQLVSLGIDMSVLFDRLIAAHAHPPVEAGRPIVPRSVK